MQKYFHHKQKQRFLLSQSVIEEREIKATKDA